MFIIICLIILVALLILGIILITRAKNPKYFHEHPSNSHKDIRYCNDNQEVNIQQELIDLLASFVEMCKKKNIRPVLAYGNLLGWYFNKKNLPWDDDIDMLIVPQDVGKFTHNVTRGKYRLEINPYSKTRSQKDSENQVDARYINTENGIFIDIYFCTPGEENGKKILYNKIDKFDRSHIEPIRKDTFEDMNIYVPNNVEATLKSNYGDDCLSPCSHGPPGDSSFCFIDNEWKQM